MSIGHKIDTAYEMSLDGKLWKLEKVSEERDLGICTGSDLKPGIQCKKAASKAMSVLGMIKRQFSQLEVPEFRLLYKCYVRPHMEYAVQAWSPYLVKDIECLEKIQRRATKMVRGLKNLNYQERLIAVGLQSLQQRRRRGDLIETFKILKGIEITDQNLYFQMAPHHHDLRGHSLKLYKKRSKTQLRRNFFSNRVVDDWNRLSQHVVDSENVNTFKRRLDKNWQDMGV